MYIAASKKFGIDLETHPLTIPDKQPKIDIMLDFMAEQDRQTENKTESPM